MQLLEWQKRFLDSDKNIVWAETGLGKGILGSYLVASNPTNSLIVCPPHLKGDWKNKIKEMGKDVYFSEKGELKEGINIISYQLMVRYGLFIKKNRISLLILDESHRAKNYKSETFKILQKFVKQNQCRVICLSATPITKDRTDILPQIFLSTPGLYNKFTFYKFLQDVAIFQTKYFGAGAVNIPVDVKNSIFEAIMKEVFRVTYDSEGLKRPLYNIKDVYIPIKEEALKAVNDFLNKEKLLDPSFDNDYILNKISNPHSTYLQAVNGFIYKKEGEKQNIEYCGLQDKIENLKEILEDSKPLVLYFFEAEKDLLKEIKGAYIYQKSSKKSIEEQIKEFESSKKYSCFVAGITAIGEGIRFKNTKEVVIFTQQYDYGKILQSIGRIQYVGNDLEKTLNAYIFKTDLEYSKQIEKNISTKAKMIENNQNYLEER